MVRIMALLTIMWITQRPAAPGLESGADTRRSTVARYAATIGMKVEWSVAPVVPSMTGRRSKSAQLHERIGRRNRLPFRVQAQRHGRPPFPGEASPLDQSERRGVTGRHARNCRA